MDTSRLSYAWIYYALHTYKLPARADRDALRIPLMPLLLAGGFALSVTGVVIGYRRLRATMTWSAYRPATIIVACAHGPESG